MTKDDGRRHARQARLAAVVIAGTMILWIGLQFLGGRLRWPARYALLFDLAAIGALLWALIVVYFVWKETRKRE